MVPGNIMPATSSPWHTCWQENSFKVISFDFDSGLTFSASFHFISLLTLATFRFSRGEGRWWSTRQVTYPSWKNLKDTSSWNIKMYNWPVLDSTGKSALTRILLQLISVIHFFICLSVFQDFIKFSIKSRGCVWNRKKREKKQRLSPGFVRGSKTNRCWRVEKRSYWKTFRANLLNLHMPPLFQCFVASTTLTSVWFVDGKKSNGRFYNCLSRPAGFVSWGDTDSKSGGSSFVSNARRPTVGFFAIIWNSILLRAFSAPRGWNTASKTHTDWNPQIVRAQELRTEDFSSNVPERELPHRLVKQFSQWCIELTNFIAQSQRTEQTMRAIVAMRSRAAAESTDVSIFVFVVSTVKDSSDVGDSLICKSDSHVPDQRPQLPRVCSRPQLHPGDLLIVFLNLWHPRRLRWLTLECLFPSEILSPSSCLLRNHLGPQGSERHRGRSKHRNFVAYPFTLGLSFGFV